MLVLISTATPSLRNTLSIYFAVFLLFDSVIGVEFRAFGGGVILIFIYVFVSV